MSDLIRNIKKQAKYFSEDSPSFESQWDKSILEPEHIDYLLKPRTFENPKVDKKKHDFLSVLSWNVDKGQDFDRLFTTLQYLDHLINLDVISLQDVSLNHPDANNRDVAFELAEALGMNAYFHTCFALYDEIGMIKTNNGLPICTGIATLSKLDLTEEIEFNALTPVHDFSNDLVSRWGNRMAMKAKFNYDNEIVNILNTHLEFNTRPKNRKKQAEQLVQLLGSGENNLAMGDFNNIYGPFEYVYKVFKQAGYDRLISEATVNGLFKVDNIFCKVKNIFPVKSERLAYKGTNASDHKPVIARFK